MQRGREKERQREKEVLAVIDFRGERKGRGVRHREKKSISERREEAGDAREREKKMVREDFIRVRFYEGELWRFKFRLVGML